MSSLRRFDVQAGYASTLALLSIVPMIAGIILTIRNYQVDIGQIVYGSKKYLIMHHASLLLAMAPAAIAVALGWNSAGERRNDRQGKSWLGFFVGASVLTITIILFIAFYMLRIEQRPTQVGLGMQVPSITAIAC